MSSKNKDWVGTGVSAFRTLGASSHTDEEREIHDYYATDPQAALDLAEREQLDVNIWECASGGGHLVDMFKGMGFNVYSTDLVDRGAQDRLIDFLNTNEAFSGDIITNPPYKFADEFILKALDLIPVGNKVCMFLKLTTLEGQRRYNKIYRKYPPTRIWVYSHRIQCGKSGEFSGSSAVAYAWYVWEKQPEGTTYPKTTIDWIV